MKLEWLLHESPKKELSMRIIFIGIAAILTTSCVTTHYGHEYQLNSGQLVYSCTKDDSINHPYIKSISCAIENTGSTWTSVRIGSFAAKSIDNKNNLTVLSAERIQNFLAAHRFEIEKNRYNSDMILTGLVMTSAIASVSGNSSIHNAGLATGLGTITAGAIMEAKDVYNNAQGNSYEFAQHHLLGPEFEIPPASFVRKTILIQSDNDSEFKAWPNTVELCFTRPENQCTTMEFWNPRD
jgi:hypothetical protein